MTIEIVSHELIVMTRVAGDIQSSSRRNSGGCRLVLKPLKNTDASLDDGEVYLDDLIICTFKEHTNRLWLVFDHIIRTAGLEVKRAKCHFLRS